MVWKEKTMKELEKIGNVTLDYSHYPGEDLYSDGSIEDELLQITREASRVEYSAIIEEKGSWPVLYHLSELRANIVDWLPIQKSHKVLEIGSGCGAITDKLSEKAGEVTCVDLSAKRSRINAYRNQDRDNITIRVGNFNDIEPELPADYDYICLIGVFEYGQSYIPTKTPYEDFLKIILRHVKKDGHIIIAIENRLGMKYFAGCKEDHAGTYFSSLEDYPEGGSARTFSRPGLEKILKSCGVSEYSFYYPYPDYKFPTEIYSDRRLPKQGELTNNIRNFDRDRMLLFHEKYAFDSVIRDGIFDIFSNSYLVVTGPALEITYARYSNDRAREYMICTELLETAEGKVIRKLPLTKEAEAHVRNMEKSCQLLTKRYQGSGLHVNPCMLPEDGSYAEFPFEKGITLSELLDECLEKEDMEEFYRLFDQYLTFISYGEGSAVTDYDFIFSNILVDGENWSVIDYEWTREEAVPAREIAFRAVYCYILEEEKRNKLNLDYIIERLGISEEEAEDYRNKELAFQKQVTGKRKSMGEIRASMGTYCVDAKKLMEEHLQKILDYRIQIYEDRGQGFSEEASYYMPDVYTSDTDICAEIPFDGNVRSLRIDPADRPCMVKIEELTLNGAALPLSKKTVISNGKSLRRGSFVFSTDDPGITLTLQDVPLQPENLLNIKLTISPLAPELAQALTENLKKWL
jgi:SAM-dependent methyltransferase